MTAKTRGVPYNVLDTRYINGAGDTMTGALTFAEAANIVLGTATGTKIGTATTQKIGFFNATPIVQEAHIVDADGTLADATTKINAILLALETYGLLAAA